MAKPNILNKKKELTAKDVAEIIFEAIQEQPILSRDKLMPVIESLIKAFTIANNQYVVERNANDRLIACHIADFRRTYWQRVTRMLDGENIQKYYDELTSLETGCDFTTNHAELAIPTGYNFDKHAKINPAI